MNGRLYAKDGKLWIDGRAPTAEELPRVPDMGWFIARLEEDRDAFIAEYGEWLVHLGWTPPP